MAEPASPANDNLVGNPPGFVSHALQYSSSLSHMSSAQLFLYFSSHIAIAVQRASYDAAFAPLAPPTPTNPQDVEIAEQVNMPAMPAVL